MTNPNRTRSLFSLLMLGITTASFAQFQSWATTTAGVGNTVDDPVDIAVDATGATIVAGNSGADMMVAKYAANGSLVWSKKFNGAGNGPDVVGGVAVDAGGNIFVTGRVQTNATTSAMTTIRFASADGSVLWTTSDVGLDGSGKDVVVSGGAVYAVGHRMTGGAMEMITIKYSASTGAAQWTSSYDSGNLDTTPAAIGADAAGNVYSLGTRSVDPIGSDFALVKYDSLGAQQWATVLDGLGGVDEARALGIDPNGNVYAVGRSQFYELDDDFATYKVRQSDGVLLWERYFDGFGVFADEAQTVSVAADGSAYVAGWLDDGRFYHTAAVKYAPGGTEVYSTDRISTKDLVPTVRGALGASGTYFVGTSATSGGTRADFYLYAVAPDGSVPWYRLWNDSFNGNDALAGLALDSSGSVIVAGSSFNPTAGNDFTAVKFQPVSLTPAAQSVVGGASLSFTLALNANPVTSAVFTLTDTSASATVPASATILSSASSIAFSMTTAPVAAAENVTVTAKYGAGWVSSTVTVRPPSVLSLTLSPTSVVGGNSSTATVTLNGTAPTGGASVTVWDNSASLSVPANVTVPEGANSATFPVSTLGVNATTTGIVSAALNGVTKSATQTLTANGPVSLSLAPASLIGGSSSTGTVTLNAPAPVGGASVTLASNNAAATVGASVLVPAGSTSAQFAISTTSVSTTVTAVITASRNGLSKTANLSVVASAISTLQLNPTAVTGGAPSTGTVTLTGPAPTGGRTVTLSSNALSRATVPVNIVIPAGSSSGTFAIASLPQTADGTATIIAGLNGANRTATLTVLRPVLVSILLSPNSIKGGQSVYAIALLSGMPKAGTAGITISLTSSNPGVAAVPVSVRVPAGATSVGFTITTSAVVADTSVTITGTAGVSQTATLIVVP